MGYNTSLIIATYNRKEKLLRCLESLNDQSYKGFEVVLIDDNSKIAVSTYLDINKYNFPIVLVVNMQNGGRAVARNNGVGKAKGEYILFTDDDCTFENTYVEIMFNALNSKEINVAGIAGRTKAMFTDIYNRYYEMRRYGMPFSLGENNEALSIVTANCIMRKSVFEEINGFDNCLVVGGEDTDLFYRTIAIGRKFYYEKSAVLYHDFDKGIKAMMNMSFRYGRSSYDISKVMPKSDQAYTDTPKKLKEKFSLKNIKAKLKILKAHNVPFVLGFFFDIIISVYFFKGYRYAKKNS